MLHVGGQSFVQFHVSNNEIEWPKFLFEIPRVAAAAATKCQPPPTIIIKGYQIIQESCNVFIYLVYHISILTKYWKLDIPDKAKAVIYINYDSILSLVRAFDGDPEWSPSINSRFFLEASSNNEHLGNIPVAEEDLDKLYMSSLAHICQSIFEIHVSQFKIHDLKCFLRDLYTLMLESLIDNIVALFSFCDKIKKM